MSLRKLGGGFALAIQAAVLVIPYGAVAQGKASTAESQTDPSGARGAIDWAKSRLSEIDATIATLEQDARKVGSDVRAGANTILQRLRATRNGYHAEIERAAADTRETTEARVSEMRAALDSRWNDFERDVEEYLTTVDAQIAVRKAVFEARLKAAQLYWDRAISDLRKSAGNMAADQWAALEARVAELKAQSDAARARLVKLEEAGSGMWSALRDGLTEARLLFDKTHDSIRTAIERAKP
ncbi:MAG: hypothetical protein KIS73_17320 [Enhydrobacter sp.]|nr:hypothetical protein [Enhydrobacter sp.]